MKNDENIEEYFLSVIREREKEDAANELMQNTDINFSPNAPKLDISEEKPKKSLPRRFIQDVGYGIYESPGAVINGLSNAAQETIHAGEDFLEAFDNLVIKNVIGEEILDDGEYAINWKKSPKGKRTTTTGKAIQDITSFIAGFFGAGKFFPILKYVAKDSGGTKIAKSVARGAWADATVFDPQEERLSNLIESVPQLQNPVTDFFRADPNDTKAAGRLKAAAEGAGVGFAAELFVQAVRVLRGSAKEQADDLLKLQKEQNQKTINDDHLEKNWADDLGPTTGPKSKKKIVGYNVFGREDGIKDKSFIAQEIKNDPFKKIIHAIDNALMPEINYNNINTEQDVVDLITEFTDSKEGKKILKQYKSERTSMPMTKQSKDNYESIKNQLGPERAKFYDETTHMKVETQAELLGVDPEIILKKYKDGKMLTEDDVMKMGLLLYASQRKLGNVILGIAKNIKNGTHTKRGMLLANDAINTHMLIQGHWDGSGRDIALALRARQYVKNINGQTQLKSIIDDQLNKMAGGEKLLIEKYRHLAELFESGLSIGNKNTAIKEMMGAKRVDRVLEVFINGILSGPKTHLVNMIGNSIVIAMRLAEVGTARLIAKATGNTDVLRGEFMAETQGMVRGFADLMRYGFKSTYKSGQKKPIGYDTTQTKLDVDRRALHTSKMKNQDFYNNTIMGPAINMFGAFIRIPGKFLMHEDAMFKTIGYRMGLHKHSFRQALADFETFKRSKKPTTMDDATWIKNRQADIIKKAEKGDKKYQHISLEASQQSHIQTFTNQVGPGGQSIQKFLMQTPYLRFLVPFFRTPYNILNYVLERNPMRVVSRKFQKQLGGAEGKEQQMMAMSKLSLGYMMSMFVIDQVTAGNITGLSNQQKGELQVKRRLGIQPYSIKFMGNWYAYNRTDPLGMTIGLAADFAEIYQAKEDATGDEFEMLDVLGGVITAISNNIINKTYMSGASELIEMMSDPTRYGEPYIKRFMGGFIPYSALQREIKKVTEPSLLETVEWLDNIRKDTIGLGGSLYPKRDFWGNAIPSQKLAHGDNTLSHIYDSVSPVYASKEANNPVDMEFLRLGISPRPIGRRLKVGNTRLDMVKYKDDFDRLKVLLNKVKLPKYGNKTLYQTLYSKTSARGYEAKLYQRLTDEDKAKYLRNIISEYKSVAKSIVFSSPKNHKLRHLLQGG